MSSPKGDETPYARLCHIVKWEDFDGYGFNLHAEKGKNGQYIGKVDEGSPSQAAGLKQGDRIIEVNEINIVNESHKRVVERIKAFPNETKLLVVDREADDYFRANNVIVKGAMTNVKVIKTPESNPNTVEGEESSDNDGVSANEIERKSSGSDETVRDDEAPTTTTTTADAVASVAADADAADAADADAVSGMATATATTTTTTVTTSSSSSENEETASRENGDAGTRGEPPSSTERVRGDATGNGSVGGNEPRQGLNLKMSAKELRAQLAARKKYDPKKETIGFKDKFDIVQKL